MAATINKDMIIADMLKIDPGIAGNSYGIRNALHRMSFCTGRDIG